MKYKRNRFYWSNHSKEIDEHIGNRFTKILVFERKKNIVYNDQIETSFLAQPTGERVQQDARRIIPISHTYIKKREK